MNINFNSGFNKVPVGQQGIRKVKEDKNAEVTSQNVQTVEEPEVADLDKEVHSTSYTTVSDSGMTVTFFEFWEDSPGDNPNNNLSTSEVLKLHSINYRNI